MNNAEVTSEDILAANATYGCLGELAILVLPQPQILSIIRKLELTGALREETAPDLLAAIRDPNVKEVVAKEALQYRPEKSSARDRQAAAALMEVGHSALHKLGRLEEEWSSILRILVKRIVAQYSDITQYKKESLGRLERMESVSKA